jgi:hypothetical protein
MAMLDFYLPQPPLPCPRCGVLLDGWQGKSGPNDLLEWLQGHPAPAGQRVDPAWALSPSQRSRLRPPATFELHTACASCGVWVEVEGACDPAELGAWRSVALLDPLEAPGLPDGWSPLRGDDRALMLDELRREIPPGHVLHRARLTPLARRRARDHVLVRAQGAPFPLYLVPLTLRGESPPSGPAVRPFQTVAEFAAAEED